METVLTLKMKGFYLELHHEKTNYIESNLKIGMLTFIGQFYKNESNGELQIINWRITTISDIICNLFIYTDGTEIL